MNFGIRYFPVFCLMILSIFVSGCMGFQVGGTSAVPTMTPTLNPTDQAINRTAPTMPGTSEQIVTPTPVPTLASTSTTGGNSAKTGDNVSVNYTGRFENGTVFDTTSAEIAKQADIFDSRKAYVPISFVIGSGSVISGFNDAVIGMCVGETRNVTLTSDQAYGEYNSTLIRPVSMSILTNAGITPHVGQTIYCNHQPVKVVNISEDNTVMIDFNSPYAGKTLQFNITLLSIQPMNTS